MGEYIIGASKYWPAVLLDLQGHCLTTLKIALKAKVGARIGIHEVGKTISAHLRYTALRPPKWAGKPWKRASTTTFNIFYIDVQQITRWEHDADDQRASSPQVGKYTNIDKKYAFHAALMPSFKTLGRAAHTSFYLGHKSEKHKICLVHPVAR